jgi:uncharacterized peroxidase-related enzyme
MSWIREILPPDADGRLQEIFTELQAKRGKVANIIQVHSLRPEAMAAHLSLYMDLLFAPGGLSRKQREMIAVVVSKTNRCDYCAAHHLEALSRYIKDPYELQQIVDNYQHAGLSPANRALLDYAVRLTLNPGSMLEDCIVRLRQQNFSDEDILLANLIVAYFNFVNRIALGLGVQFTSEEVAGYKA